MKNLSYVKSLFAFCLLTCSQILAAETPDEWSKFIESARVKYNVPGVSVSIVKDDKIIYSKGFGVNEIDKPGKVDENTIFQLASVSKTFASAGLAVQVDQKKITWDEEIIRHLPQFALKQAYPTRYATARDLLAHRTGLPAFGGDLLGKLGYTRDEILYRVRFIEPASSFRNKEHYSNIGFFVAGQLLAQIAGTTFENAVQTTLLDPLKMQRTGFDANLEKSNVAYPHAKIDGKTQVVARDKSTLLAAAGGVSSSANDMGNWMIMHLNKGFFQGKQILQAETVFEMHSPSMVAEVSFTEMPPINKLSSFSFGLGWDNYNYKGKFIVEKGGALDGVRSVVTLIPELNVGITVLCNLNLTILPEVIRAHFLESYLGKSDQDLSKEFDEKEKIISGILAPQPKPKTIIPLKRDLSLCVGKYNNELYGEFLVVQAGDQLILKGGPGQYEGQLVHWSNDSFVLKWPMVNSGFQLVTFVFGPEGKAEEFQSDVLGVFKRVEPK